VSVAVDGEGVIPVHGAIQGIVDGLIALVVLVWVVRRQMSERRVGARRVFTVPLIMAVIGIASLVNDKPHADKLLSATGLGLLAVGLVIGVGMGVARALSQRLYWRDGVAYARGTGLTMALWLGTVALRIGMAALGAVLHAPEGTGEILIFLALTLAVQNVVLMRRAGIPLAAVGAPSSVGSRD
jgi:hypothetical protein